MSLDENYLYTIQMSSHMKAIYNATRTDVVWNQTILLKYYATLILNVQVRWRLCIAAYWSKLKDKIYVNDFFMLNVLQDQKYTWLLFRTSIDIIMTDNAIIVACVYNSTNTRTLNNT